MAIYTVQDTTMTALGDAVRKHTVKFVEGDVPTSTPFWTRDVDSTTHDYSQWVLDDSNWSEQNWYYNYEEEINILDIIDPDLLKYEKNGALNGGIRFDFHYECNMTGFYPEFIGIRFYENEEHQGYNYVQFGQYQGGVLEYDGSAFINIAQFQNRIPYFAMKIRKYSIDRGHNFTFHIEAYPASSYNNYLNINTMTPATMIEKIDGLSAFPEDRFLLTGGLHNRFSSGYGWDWTLEKYIDKWYTSNVSALYSAFDGNKIEKIPFEINGGTSSINCDKAFNQCSKLKELPILNLPTVSVLVNMFYYCHNLREITDEQWNVQNYTRATYDSWNNIFAYCYSLRKIPTKLLNNLWNTYTSYYSSAYYRPFMWCCSMDEINGLGVSTATLTSNVFRETIDCCQRLKNFTFAINEDGTPKTANWNNQVLDLTYQVGYDNNVGYIIKYNSGITADKEVKDDATYQALKNDPDWFTKNIDYSRYNHDSAVNTINSLPDTSAYGTNTIKFKGQSGALTDGGAINTLTEEEIAVATSRGWTVSLV